MSYKFEKKRKLDHTFLKIARVLSEQSHCVSRQVGAVFVKEGRILISGINGTVAGETNCDEIFSRDGFGTVWDAGQHRHWSDKNEIHAEQNGIIYAAKHGIALDGCTVYSTLQPCDHCVKMLAAVGAKRIVFAQLYDRVEATAEVEDRLRRLKINYELIEV